MDDLASSEIPEQIHSVYFDEAAIPDTFLYGTQTSGIDWLEEIIVDTSNPNQWIVYFTVLAG